MTTTIVIDDRQLGTVLAALRFWQRQAIGAGNPNPPVEMNLASIDGMMSPLAATEIDDLCAAIRVAAGETTENGAIPDDVPAGIYGELVTLDGRVINGTLESLSGMAVVTAAARTDGELYLCYGGDTEIFWDDQKTVRNFAGQRIFVTESGDCVAESQVRLVFPASTKKVA